MLLMFSREKIISDNNNLRKQLTYSKYFITLTFWSNNYFLVAKSITIGIDGLIFTNDFNVAQNIC